MRYTPILLVAMLACGLTACGNKGKLKSPSQIEAEQKKEAAREQKKAAKEKTKPAVDKLDAETPAPDALPQGSNK